MPTVISATEAKNRFGEVIRRVYRDGETFIVERDGLPVVMIVPVEGRLPGPTVGQRRFARAVQAAVQEAAASGLTEEDLERTADEIREHLHRERWGA